MKFKRPCQRLTSSINKKEPVLLTMAMLKKHPHPSFVKVYKTFAFKHPEKYMGTYHDPRRGTQTGHNAQFVLQETLKPLPKEYQQHGHPVWRAIIGATDAYAFGGDYGGEKTAEDVQNKIGQNPPKGMDKFGEKLWKTSLEGLAHLKSLGITYRDLWWKNMMVDKMGNPKMIDIGYTRGGGLEKAEKPEKMEEAKRIVEGGIGKLGGDAADILSGLVMMHKEKSDAELAKLAKAELPPEDVGHVSDNELINYIKDIRRIFIR